MTRSSEPSPMSQPSELPPRVPDLGRFRLGDWEVNQAENTLCSGGRSVRLERRVMDVLVYLAAEPEKVISKEELLEAVWGGAFVEEGALTQSVHSLRKALGDDARQPRYIQTIPKRGYRLVAPVALESAPGVSEVAVEVPSSPPSVSALPQPGQGRKRTLLRLTAFAIAAVFALGITWDYLAAKRRDPEQPRAADSGMRIVVIPFENLGSPEDPYFADGLTEEITANLSLLASLQVISRMTARRYRDERRPLHEIGEDGVDYVLQGTVRWAEGGEGRARVRITLQLIRVADDTQAWTNTYEEDVLDIFKVQKEISLRVIEALGLTLMPEETLALREQSTENLEAHRAYIRGLTLKNQPFYSALHLEKAARMFERAVELDPHFTEAWAELSQVHSYIAFNTDRSPKRVKQALQALDQAVALAPDRPAVLLAQAYFSYRCLGDFDAALAQVSAAERRWPHDAKVLETLGLLLRRKGKLPEGIDALQRASELDPLRGDLVWAIAETYRALRAYGQADRFFAQAISLAPDEPFFWEQRALTRLAWTGSVQEARSILEDAPVPGSPGLVPLAVQLDLYEDEYERALKRLVPERVQELPLQEQSRLAMFKVIARARLGDHGSALKMAEENRAQLEKRAILYPNEPIFRAYLAVALAQLGQGGEALEQAERAVREKRHDAFSGPRLVEIQAIVDVTLGRRREAVARLARLLTMRYRAAICTAELRLDPVWDPLRNDPGFEALLRRYEN